MKRYAVVFFGNESVSLGVFSGKFGEIWAKSLHTPKNLPAPTPMHASTQLVLSANSVVEHSYEACSSIRHNGNGYQLLYTAITH